MGPEKARERARAEHLKRPFQMLYSGLLTGSSLGPPGALSIPPEVPWGPQESSKKASGGARVGPDSEPEWST